jgi:peptidoglycan hydrolase-like protein with peptidoglycan-binding domain
VLVPGAEGETVAAVQEALVAAGIDVPGGADGVYGNDTMAAVAAYQRTRDGIQVTGAVDLATARALGVYVDPEAAAAPTTTATVASVTTVAPTVSPIGAPAPAVEPVPSETADGGELSRRLVVVAATVVVLAALIVARRRHVVAQRAARRWARVHPATSPRRSVADMRRAGAMAGELAAVEPRRRAALYDQELEEPGPAAASALPVRRSSPASTSPGTSGIQNANTRCATTETSATSSGTPTAVSANVVAASIPPVATKGIGSELAR